MITKATQMTKRGLPSNDTVILTMDPKRVFVHHIPTVNTTHIQLQIIHSTCTQNVNNSGMTDLPFHVHFGSIMVRSINHNYEMCPDIVYLFTLLAMYLRTSRFVLRDTSLGTHLLATPPGTTWRILHRVRVVCGNSVPWVNLLRGGVWLNAHFSDTRMWMTVPPISNCHVVVHENSNAHAAVGHWLNNIQHVYWRMHIENIPDPVTPLLHEAQHSTVHFIVSDFNVNVCSAVCNFLTSLLLNTMGMLGNIVLDMESDIFSFLPVIDCMSSMLTLPIQRIDWMIRKFDTELKKLIDFAVFVNHAIVMFKTKSPLVKREIPEVWLCIPCGDENHFEETKRNIAKATDGQFMLKIVGWDGTSSDPVDFFSSWNAETIDQIRRHR